MAGRFWRVEGAEDLVSIELREGVGDGICVEMVVVDFRVGAVAGVESGIGGFDVEDANVGREERIEGEEEARQGDGDVGVEMGGLAEGVDAGVGAA